MKQDDNGRLQHFKREESFDGTSEVVADVDLLNRILKKSDVTENRHRMKILFEKLEVVWSR